MAKVTLQRLSITHSGFRVGATVDGKGFVIHLSVAEMEDMKALPPDQRRKNLAQRALTEYRASVASNARMKALLDNALLDTLSGKEDLP